MNTSESNYLFLVVLGGRADKANVELHDVRWVVGSHIEDTFNDLRNNWFGSIDGLHIDRFKKIEYIDCYKINLKIFDENKLKNKQSPNQINSQHNLWFVNIGGYDPSSMQEKHEFGLVVASSKFEAKNIAKSKWLMNTKKKHKDDLASLKMLIGCDDCEPVKKIGNWEVELTLETDLVEETNNPDWYGYKRID